MDDAERQRTMDFILRQQAQFSAGIQRNEEQLATLRRVVVLMARQFRNDRSDLKERINALIDAQLNSEEKQSRSSEWQSQMEKNFARAEARMTRLEKDAERTHKDAERNGKEIAALLETTRRNSEAIARLTASQDRNSEAIDRLAESNDRNSETVARLAEVVSELARARHGGS